MNNQLQLNKYEGHSTGWKHKINHSTYSIINDDGQKVASVPCYEECNKDSQLIADAPLLLAEVKRLREGIRSILSDYDITELIRDVSEDEWNFEQQALIRMKELIE
jgi:hypothetical protein